MEDWGVSNSMGSMNGGMDSVNSMDGSVNGMDSMDRGMDSMDSTVYSMYRGMGNDWSMDSMGSMMGRGRSIVGNTFIGDISNIATVFISSVVVDHLDSTIRKSNSIRSRSGVAISLLILAELGSTVIISNAILESIVSRLFIAGLMSVARCRGHAKGSSQQSGQNSNSLHVDDSMKFFQLIPC